MSETKLIRRKRCYRCGKTFEETQMEPDNFGHGLIYRCRQAVQCAKRMERRVYGKDGDDEQAQEPR